MLRDRVQYYSRLIYWKIGLLSAALSGGLSLYNNGRYLQTLEVKGTAEEESQHR